MKHQLLAALVVITLMSLIGTCTPSFKNSVISNNPSGNTDNSPLNAPESRIRETDGMPLVYVPAGQFEMGSSSVQLDAAMQLCAEQTGDPQSCLTNSYSDEQPVQSITLEAFWIDRYEVSNAQFVLFLNEQGNQQQAGVQWWEPGAGHRKIIYGFIEENNGVYSVKNGYENYPVVEVSWFGAAAYCQWAGAQLPAEKQWEYAARGPQSFVYPWGDIFDPGRANFEGGNSWTPVGSYPQGASWCGALDLAGNIWEWTADRWTRSYLIPSATPSAMDVRVVRGGSWYDPPWHLRSAFRKGLDPSSARMHWVGIRCVQND